MDQDNERWRQGPGLASSLWRYKWAIVALTVLAGLAAYMLSAQRPTMYTATTDVLLRDPRDPGLLGSAQETRFIEPESFFAQQARRIESPAVLEAAAAELGGDTTPESIGRSIRAVPEPALNTIAITAERGSAAEAATFANAVANAYEAVAAEDTMAQAERAVGAIEEQLADLRARAEEAETAAAADPEDTVAASRARILTERVMAMESTASNIAAQAAVKGSGVEAIRPAQTPGQPSSPTPERDAAIAALLGFLLASVGAYWLAGRDDRVRSAGVAAEILGVPLLGEVPKFRLADSTTVAGRLTVPPDVVEAFQFVLTSIEYALPDRPSTAVLISSAAPGDGKTVSSLQLALAARRQDRDVTLVDADLRAEGLTTLLAAKDSPGLANLVRRQVSPAQATKRYRIDDDVILPVVTAGEHSSDAVALLRSGGLSKALEELRESTELLIVDTPPVLAAVDASAAAAHVDGVVLIVSPETSAAKLRRMLERLSFVDTPVLGFVYNRANPDSTSYDYAYATNHHGPWWARQRRRSGSSRSVPAPVTGGRDRARARVSPFSPSEPVRW